jgi:hypothetical protein
VQPLGEPRAAGVEADHRASSARSRLELGASCWQSFLGVRQLGQSIAPG